MSALESLHLLALVIDTYGDAAAYRRQIENGTWIVVMCRTKAEFWILWDFADWRQYRRAEKASVRKLALERARAKAKRKSKKQLLEVAC